jgi:protein-S-isoprenylcysteine O-methyltransferase Ste14
MIVPWLTPHMTIGQLVFALGTAVYVLVATAFEEADLIAELGETYRKYRRHVPAFLPLRRR